MRWKRAVWKTMTGPLNSKRCVYLSVYKSTFFQPKSLSKYLTACSSLMWVFLFHWSSLYINFPGHFFPELTKISCGASKKEGYLMHGLGLHSQVNTVRVTGSHCFSFHVSSFLLVAIGLIVQHIKDILNGNKSSETDGVHNPGQRQRHLSDSSMVSSRPHWWFEFCGIQVD